MAGTATTGSFEANARSKQVLNAGMTEFDIDATEPDGRILVVRNCYLVVGGASDLPISLGQWRIQVAEQGEVG